MVASEGLGTLEDAEAIKPLKLWSFAEATASGLGSGGADSSPGAGVLARVVFTWMGAESCSFVSGSGLAPMFAAIRITGESATPADGLSGGATVAVLGAEVCVTELARPGVPVEGAPTGENVGAGAAAGCLESWGVLRGCALDLPSFP
jgi:hypothetical protein